MSIKMYLLTRDGRDDDFIAVKDDKIVVHSSLLKQKWNDPISFGNFDKYNSHTFESYYGDTKDNILNKSILIWEK